jgi:hypothetical protein
MRFSGLAAETWFVGYEVLKTAIMFWLPVFQLLSSWFTFQYFPKATRGLEQKEALLSTLLHATAYVYTQFVECPNTDC